MNDYFNDDGNPGNKAPLASAAIRTLFAAIETGFDKLCGLTGNGSKIVAINAGATAQEALSTTGTGNVVRATSPTLVTPVLGTPTSGTLTNCTGLPISTGVSGLGTGVAAGLASAVTGSGSPVLATSPTLVTPALGTPSSGDISNCTGTPTLTGTNISGTASALNIGGNAATATTATTATTASDLSGTPTFFAPIENSLTADVSISDTSNFFDGPSVAQGTSGKWFVSGTVQMVDSSNIASYLVRLWDGTTAIAEASMNAATSQNVVITLSGYIDTPAGNLRISVKNPGFTTSVIRHDSFLSANDVNSKITAFRIG